MWNLCIYGFPLLACGVAIYGAFFKKYKQPEQDNSDNEYNPFHGGIEDDSIL